MPTLPKNAKESKIHQLTWTPALESYWAGYFDGRHKAWTSPKTGQTKYRLESPILGHLRLLHIKYPRRDTRTICRYSDGKLTDTFYRFTVDQALHLQRDIHYLRGWYDSKFQVIYNKERKEIHLTGKRPKLEPFIGVYEHVFNYKPKFQTYHPDSDSLRFKLTGEKVDLFLGTIFDEECFLYLKWPKRFEQRYKSYRVRRYARTTEDFI